MSRICLLLNCPKAFSLRITLVLTLLFFGLQGSMRRGEARADSHIDVVIVLETLTRADLSRLRILLDSLPEGDRAHGFSAGRRDGLEPHG